MDKIMNIGIIGAGVVAERIINAASVNPRANIKSIYDVNVLDKDKGFFVILCKKR